MSPTMAVRLPWGTARLSSRSTLLLLCARAQPRTVALAGRFASSARSSPSASRGPHAKDASCSSTAHADWPLGISAPARVKYNCQIYPLIANQPSQLRVVFKQTVHLAAAPDWPLGISAPARPLMILCYQSLIEVLRESWVSYVDTHQVKCTLLSLTLRHVRPAGMHRACAS